MIDLRLYYLLGSANYHFSLILAKIATFGLVNIGVNITLRECRNYTKCNVYRDYTVLHHRWWV